MIKKFTVVGTFCYHTETIFEKTKRQYFRKGRFPLSEVAILLIIMEIRLALPKNKISSKTNCHSHGLTHSSLAVLT